MDIDNACHTIADALDDIAALTCDDTYSALLAPAEKIRKAMNLPPFASLDDVIDVVNKAKQEIKRV